MGILSHIFGIGLKKWIADHNPDPEVIGGLLTCDDRWVTLKSGEEEEGGRARGRRVLLRGGKIVGGNVPKEAQGMNVQEWGEKAGKIMGTEGSGGGGNAESENTKGSVELPAEPEAKPESSKADLPAFSETTTEEPKEEPVASAPVTGLADMRKRLSIEEPEGSEFDKKYGQYFVTKDGERAAKLVRWKNRMTGEETYALEALQRSKKRSSIIIPDCSTKEDLLDKYAMKLFTEEQEKQAREAESKERAKKIREAKRVAALTGATEANRQEATKAAFDEPEGDLKPKPKEPYHFTPKQTKIHVGNLDVEATDFTGVVPAKIELANKKTILNDPHPSWIPEISDDGFNGMGGRLEGAKIGEDRYVIKTKFRASTYSRGFEHGTSGEEYAIVNLAVLTATQDYYSKRLKAKHDQSTKAAVELGNGVVETMRKMHRGMMPVEAVRSLGGKYADMTDEQATRFADIASGEYDRYLSMNKRYKDAGRNQEYSIETRIKSFLDDIDRRAKKSRPKTIGTNRATYSHLALIGQVKPEAKGDVAKWKEINDFVADMKQMSIDMNLQMEENENTYSKGQETSYGRKGVVKDLLDSHGVVVKRQNGDAITSVEVDEIKNAIGSVYSVFGDQSGVAKRTNLLISHSGEKLMHARKASGIYSPVRNAIGVTWQTGQKDAGFTLSHEFAHFMDHQLGAMDGKYSYASDDRKGKAYEIASTFRRSMASSQSSDYQNRTCECFARALEQYFSVKTGDHAEYQATWNEAGNHPKHEVFMERVHPLVESFLTDLSKKHEWVKKSLDSFYSLRELRF